MAATVQGLYGAELWRTVQLNQRYALHNIERMADDQLRFGGPAITPRYLREQVPYLREERLAGFGTPQELSP